MAANILVVESEQAIAATLSERLRALRYQIVGSVASGEHALEAVATERPDLVLLNLTLHRPLDGVETADRIREAFDVPVVFVTADTNEATLELAHSAAPFGYVVQPFSSQELRATIEQALFQHANERKLRRMERWLSTTLRSIGEGVLTVDSRGLVTFLNEQAELITGWSRLAATGRKATEVFVAVDEDADEPVSDPVRHALHSGRTIELGAAIALRRRDGTILPIGASAAPIRDDQGGVLGVVVVFRDRSSRRAAEEARRAIERQVQEAQRLESLTVLAGGIAHDFNNLLAVILGNAELCAPHVPEGSEAHRYLAAIEKSTQQAARLCQQMLAFAGKSPQRATSLSLATLLTDTTSLLRASISSLVDLQVDVDPATPRVRGDAGQLRQLAMNLISNAAEAIAEAHGTVIVRARRASADDLSSARIDPPLAPGTYAILEVEDSGCGMDPATLERSFDPFFSTKFTGRGLGLAAVKGIVRAHGGRISVDSRVGLGTSFRVYLPVESNPRAGVGGNRPRNATPLAPGRVLIADDKSSIRTMIRLMLERQGFEVVEARDGSEAVDLYRQGEAPFAFVILDLTMPNRNGFEALQAMRSVHGGVRSILISGYAESDTLRSLGDQGPDVFLQKPFTPAQLSDAIARIPR